MTEEFKVRLVESLVGLLDGDQMLMTEEEKELPKLANKLLIVLLKSIDKDLKKEK